MKRFALLLVVLVAAPALAADDVVSYDIQANLDVATHRLLATETVRWSNTTATPTNELWLHLYLNAFANPESTFMRESRRGWGRGGYSEPEQWGWTRITRLETDDGVDLLPALEFRRPDDGNDADRTVARVALPAVVEPGSSVRLQLTFEAQLPTFVARTGYADTFYMVGQWFPKLGVFVPGRDGRPATWNCHQFHADSEFFADFGSYRVTLTIPAGWRVAATGVEVRRDAVQEGSTEETRVTFRADRVHDFAWSTAPPDVMTVVDADFDPARDVPREWLERSMAQLGLSAAELELPPTHLRLLLPVAQSGLAERVLRAARLALAWCGLHYGPYPYPQLTLVSPPATAQRAAGGMEYPTLVTIGASWWMLRPPQSWVGEVEVTTVHEIAHQYFYGLLASNEFEEPWLDEGFATYVESSCITAALDDRLLPEPVLRGPWGGKRLGLAMERLPTRVDQPAWAFRSAWSYAIASYDEASVALLTLERQLGAGLFARALRAYAERFRFRHPSGDDLVATLKEVTGADVSWFPDQVLRGDARPDWAVLSVRSWHPDEPEGYTWKEGRWQEVSAPTGGGDAHEEWVVEVDVGRKGTLVAPVTVELTLDDGTSQRFTWDSRARWTRFTVKTASPAAQVVVDPDGDWPLETKRADNYWRAEPSHRRSWRMLWWLPAALWSLASAPVPWS